MHIKRTGNLRSEWEWRILQRSKEIGVGLYGRGFATAEAARRNGESALEKFLADLALGRASTGNRPATSTNDCPNLSGTETGGAVLASEGADQLPLRRLDSPAQASGASNSRAAGSPSAVDTSPLNLEGRRVAAEVIRTQFRLF